MKKITLIILLVLAASTVNAQIEKGDFQISGNISYYSTDNGFNSIEFFRSSVQPGMFISNYTSLGVSLGYESNGDSNRLFTYGVFGRFYKPIVDRFYFRLSTSILLGSGEDTIGDRSYFGIDISPGVSYFLADWFALNTSMGQLSYTQEEAGGFTSDTFNFNFNPSSISLGATFIIK